MPATSPDQLYRPDWLRISAFTGAGALLLVIAYFFESQYVQGVLVNGGTALLLFALLVFAEPGLRRRIDEAARQPASLGEAQSRVAARLGSRSGPVADHDQIKRNVIVMVGRAGLVAQPPEAGSVRLTSPDGALPVDWWVQWDADAVRHVVTVAGADAAAGLPTSLPWAAGADRHERLVFQLLCRVLMAMDRQQR